MNIETDFISDPYYSTDFVLHGEYNLVLNWNIFKDKKDDNKLVLRVRYVLNQFGERRSLKNLKLVNPVVFKQIYVTDEIVKELEMYPPEYIINMYFGDWLKSDDFIGKIYTNNLK